MRVATANVKTLMPAQETKSYGKISGAMLFHRMQLLEQQFAANNLQIVGVQEGRSRTAAVVDCRGFIWIGLVSVGAMRFQLARGGSI